MKRLTFQVVLIILQETQVLILVAKVYILLSLTLFFCQQQSKKETLKTDTFKYPAYLWHMNSDTPIFYLAHYLDIDKNGHYSLMRRDTFMDAPKYFAGVMVG